MINLEKVNFTGNLIIDAQEKSERTIAEVSRAWEKTGNAGTISRSLGARSGDYALEYHDEKLRSQIYDGIRVEAKWISKNGEPNDLFSSLSMGYDRINRELQNLSEKHPLSLFLAEGKASDLEEHSTPGGVGFDQIINTLFSLNAKYRIPVIFSEDAPQWLVSWMFASQNVIGEDIGRGTLTLPRFAEVFTDEEKFMRRLGKSYSAGDQFFLGFKAPKQSRRLCRLMALHGIGLWFFDGASKDELEGHLINWLRHEDKEVSIRASGGFPDQPEKYNGALRLLGRGKSQYYPPKGSKIRQKRKATVLFKNSQGESPVIVLFESPKIRGSEIQILKPERLDGEKLKVENILSMKDLNPLSLIQIGKVKDSLRTEAELIPEVLRRAHKYWKVQEGKGELKECSDTSSGSLGRASLESAPQAKTPSSAPDITGDGSPENLHVSIVTGPEKPSSEESSSPKPSPVLPVMEEDGTEVESLTARFISTDEDLQALKERAQKIGAEAQKKCVDHFLKVLDPAEPVMFNPEPFKFLSTKDPLEAIRKQAQKKCVEHYSKFLAEAEPVIRKDIREEFQTIKDQLKRIIETMTSYPPSQREPAELLPLKPQPLQLLNIVSPDELQQAMLEVCGLGKVKKSMQIIALKMADLYGFELALGHIVPIKNKLYVTRDGLLHNAHRSGQFDGMEVLSEGGDRSKGWWAKVSVYRKDMSRPFTYRGRYSGPNKEFGPEMAVKCAEAMCLRRAFNISLCSQEERWDVESEPVIKAIPFKPEPITVEEITKPEPNIKSARAVELDSFEEPVKEDHKPIIAAAFKETNFPFEHGKVSVLDMVASLNSTTWDEWTPTNTEALYASEYVRFLSFASDEMCWDAALFMHEKDRHKDKVQIIPTEMPIGFTDQVKAQLRKTVDESVTDMDTIYDGICAAVELCECPF